MKTLIAFYLLLSQATGRLTTRVSDADHHLDRRHDERGSITIEQVWWAVAVLALAAIVFAAISAYVKSKAGDIGG